MALAEVIEYILGNRPNLTDRELGEAIYGSDDRHQQINSECRHLEQAGVIIRELIDGLIRNRLVTFPSS